MPDQKRPYNVVQLNFESTVVLPPGEFDDLDSIELGTLGEESPQESDLRGLHADNDLLPEDSGAPLLSINARHAAALRDAQVQSGLLQDELAAARQQAAAQIAALEKSLHDLHATQNASAAEMRAAADRVSELSVVSALSQGPAKTQQRNALESDGDTKTTGQTGGRNHLR